MKTVDDAKSPISIEYVGGRSVIFPIFPQRVADRSWNSG